MKTSTGSPNRSTESDDLNRTQYIAAVNEKIGLMRKVFVYLGRQRGKLRYARENISSQNFDIAFLEGFVQELIEENENIKALLVLYIIADCKVLKLLEDEKDD